MFFNSYYESLYNSIQDVSTEEQNVFFDGYIGSWSAFQKVNIDGSTFYIYEHNTYGDMTSYLVVQFVDDMPIAIFETYDNIIQCLIDEDVI